jgi:peptide alpha-N-acetyltransferase
VYAEAAKCYLNALRCDPDNSQILQDLALLQVQLRDAPGFVATRTRLLHLKPAARANWIALAVAHHLAGHREVAASVLAQYSSISPDNVPLSERYEHSELLLYRAMLLEEDNQPAWALAHLEAAGEEKLVDKQGAAEARGRLQLALGQLPAAEATYRGLLALNPDTHEYHDGLRAALGLGGDVAALPDAGVARLADEYAALSVTHPRSSAVRRLPLDFLRGDAFEAAAAAYIRPFLRKGVPALFSDLSPLYGPAGDSAKAASLGRVIAAADAALDSRGAFPGAADGSEQPSTRCWSLLLLAQHHARTGALPAALAAIDAAIEHTPTVIDLYTAKARIMAQAGDVAGAASLADEARRMDLADRYLNSIAVQALLAADRLADAEATAALFAKPSAGAAGGEPPPPGATNLTDMQCQWYALGVADCHARARRWGPALKRYAQIRKHFEDFQEDQFDFHAYCIRKMTLRAYVRMLRLVDNLPGHAFFRAAAAGAIRAYLALADAAAAKAAAEAAGGPGAGMTPEEAALAAMPPNERKKARAKARKAEAAAAAAATAAAGGSSTAGSGAAGDGDDDAAAKKPAAAAAAAAPSAKADPDPDGAALAGTADPLGEATRWVASLTQHASGELDTHLLAAEVYCRKGRLLLALRSVLRARALAAAPGAPPAAAHAAHAVTVRFLRDAAAAAASGDAAVLPPPVAAVLREGAAEVLAGAASAAAFNDAFLAAAGGGEAAKAAHAAAAALLA